MTARFWWVNQGDSYRRAADQRTLWAPYSSDKTGRDQEHWRRMDDVRPGDVVMHYSVNKIRAVSVVRSPARPATVSIQRGAQNAWSDMGREVALDIHELDPPILLSSIPLLLRQRWSLQYSTSPFDRRGQVKQGYLFELESVVHRDIVSRLGLAAALDDDDVEIGNSGEPGSEFAIAYKQDGEAVVVTRGEHAQLHRIVFEGRKEHRCDLCGRQLPISLLVLAHIKRRSHASDDEKLDRSIAMRACALGCDDLYERGFLTVNHVGRIEPGKAASGAGPDLAAAVRERTGLLCTAFSEASAPFFAWHRERNR